VYLCSLHVHVCVADIDAPCLFSLQNFLQLVRQHRGRRFDVVVGGGVVANESDTLIIQTIIIVIISCGIDPLQIVIMLMVFQSFHSRPTQEIIIFNGQFEAITSIILFMVGRNCRSGEKLFGHGFVEIGLGVKEVPDKENNADNQSNRPPQFVVIGCTQGEDFGKSPNGSFLPGRTTSRIKW
jgi:hypothetical protein